MGKVQKNPRGFAFLIPQGKDGVADAYVPKEEASFLLNDDIVEFEMYREGRRAAARVLRVVRRGQKKVVGRVRIYKRDVVLEADDGEAHIITQADRGLEDQWVIAEIEKYPSREGAGVVRVVDVLGPELLPEHDYKIAVARYGLEDRFAMDVLIDARRRIEDVKPGRSRKDLRSLPFVTIDGEDAKDFDDAVYVKSQSGREAFVLYVAIADVSAYVLKDSPLDKSARARSTSVYFPGFCIPMLPELLSNDVCSLRPRVDRLTLTAEIGFDRDGNMLRTDFYESLICTARRMTYNEVQRYFDRDPATLKECDFLKEPLHDLRMLYQKLAKQRSHRGALDFELPECRIEIDEKGWPVKSVKAVRLESHKLIEEFMIAANQAVAAVLKDTGTPALYRVHDTPKLEALQEINALLKMLGFTQRLADLSPKSISEILKETAGLNSSKTLHTAILRLQKQARYDASPDGHFGLALEDYTHFTSPIRRYPDLVVHRALKQFIKNSSGADTEGGEVREAEEVLEELARVGPETSERERKAMDAERFAVKRKQCWFMLEKIGDVYEGKISGLHAKGLFIEIAEYAIEGFLPLESMHEEYEYDEARNCVKKTSGGGVLTLGDEITIEVFEVSIEKNEITFSEPE